MPERILICEDDPCLARLLGHQLRAEGYAVTEALAGREALEQVEHHRPDLVVLDLALPDMDGLDVCRRLRRSAVMPIIIISGRGSVLDRIIGLEVGADDYLTKPFRTEELLARIEAQLRRAGVYACHPGPTGAMVLGDLTIDREAREVAVAGRPVHLTPKEFDLLWALAEHRGGVVRSDSLLMAVWGYDSRIRTRTLDVHIGRLRAKVEPDRQHPQRIVTVAGVGYRLCMPQSPELAA